MKKGKRIKPRLDVEYRLLITKRYKEREKKNITRLALRTINEFSNFRYEMVVQYSVSDHRLRLDIHGLRTPHPTLPGFGPATFETEFDNLEGRYEVIITKLQDRENIYIVDISENDVIVRQSPRNIFVEVVTNEKEW